MEFGSCPVSEISDFFRVSPGWTWTSPGPQGDLWRHRPACPALCCLHLDVFGGNVPVRRGGGYLGAEGRLTLWCSSWRRTNAWYPAVFTALSYVPLASMKTTSGENLQAQPRNCVLFFCIGPSCGLIEKLPQRSAQVQLPLFGLYIISLHSEMLLHFSAGEAEVQLVPGKGSEGPGISVLEKCPLCFCMHILVSTRRGFSRAVALGICTQQACE